MRRVDLPGGLAMTSHVLRFIAAAAMLLATADADAVLRADYRFQGTLTSSVAGAPALTNFGAGNGFATESINGGSQPVLTFPQGGGVSLPTVNTIVPGNTYSLAMFVRLVDVSGYRKYVDFKNRTSDNGVYVLDGALNFYNFATGTTAPIAANVLNFFLDDSVTTGGEASAGAVARLQVYDNALTPAEVAGLGLGPPPAVIPTLSSGRLFALAALLAVLGLVALRRREERAR